MRVFNFSFAFAGEIEAAKDKIAIAIVFHDPGIWIGKTFDYFLLSHQLARNYLEKSDREAWADEIEVMVDEHHKFTRYRSNTSWLVESFRKADRDWIDITSVMLRFRLPDDFVTDVLEDFSNTGLHKKAY